MKQVILLEEHEVKRLNKGRQIEITTPSGILVIGFELPSPLKAIKNGDEAIPRNYCKTCDRTFKNPHALSIHKATSSFHLARGGK